jgi:hypothetical protein
VVFDTVRENQHSLWVQGFNRTNIVTYQHHGTGE